MSEEAPGQRLPPPAFPPGFRRMGPSSRGFEAGGLSTTSEPSVGGDSDSSAAAERPDWSEASANEDGRDLTLISPDEPLPGPPEPPSMPDFGLEEEGVVTGIGDDAHLDRDYGVPEGDPALRDLVRAVTTLAEALRRKGQAGLRVTPSMSRFEATLRSYCVGYLAGRRAEMSGDSGEAPAE